MRLRLTPTKNMLPRSSLSKSHLMPLSVVGSRLVRLGFFGFVFSFPNNELIFIIRLFASSCFFTCGGMCMEGVFCFLCPH